MNQLMSFEPSVAPNLTNNKIIQNPLDAQVQSDTKEGGTDFLSLMLSQLQGESVEGGEAILNLDTLDSIITQTSMPEELEDLTFEKATFTQILKILEVINGGEEVTKFPNISDKLDSILKNETALNEFKNVKSIDDLMNLSKKFDLGLEKLTITKDDVKTLEQSFPKLAEKNFFEPKQQNVISSENLLKTKQPKTEMVDSKKEEINPLKDLMKSIETTTKKSELTSQNNDVKTEQPKQQEIKPEIKVDTKSQNTEVKTEQPKQQEIKPEIKVDTKSQNTEVKTEQPKQQEIKPEVKVDTKPQNSDVKTEQPKQQDIKPEVKVDTKPQNNEVKTEQPKQQDIKPEVKVDTKSQNNEVKTEQPKQQDIKQNIEIKSETKTEVKVDTKITQESSKITQNTSLEQAIKDVKPQKVTVENNQNKTTLLNATDKVVEGEKQSSENQGGESKNENSNQSSLAKEVGKTSNLNKNSQPIKQTLNTFAQEFKEKVENYKPPVMKVQMALNPKNLGEVEVTLVNRGNNLHVNVTSNTQTMNIFMQNQAEFKTSLVNMGFTNLEMNFSDQRESNQDQQQNRNNKNSNGEFFEENEEFFEENTSLEMIIPDYV